MKKTFEITPIGFVKSPFKEKFGIPRQSGLVPSIRGTICLVAPYNQPEMVAGLEAYSHLWVEFIFHQIQADHWKPQVRPPRLGGNQRLGVFATRSPFRPNRLGLSVVALDGIDVNNDQVILRVSGLDLLDQTPVVDIKPYIAYADSHESAVCGFASDAPENTLRVTYSAQARQQLSLYTQGDEMMASIRAILSLDPRPAYQKNKPQQGRVYGIKVYDVDVKWVVSLDQVEVISLERCHVEGDTN